jgi:P pilus assembly chaperone PapD
MIIRIFRVIFLALFICSFTIVFGQSGMSVSPPRTYFTLNPGETETKIIKVINTSKTEILDLAISFNDWKYDELGSNVISDPNSLINSCYDWIKTTPTVFTLGPKEEKEIEVRLDVPANISKEDVHTVMMYITQTNVLERPGQNGETLIITLQTGVKLYHRLNTARNLDIEFVDFKYVKSENKLVLKLENIGNVWAEGKISNELISQETGEHIKLEDQIFYSLPGDERTIYIELPENLAKGEYLVNSIFELGEKDLFKIAELNFIHEK